MAGFQLYLQFSAVMPSWSSATINRLLFLGLGGRNKAKPIKPRSLPQAVLSKPRGPRRPPIEG
ncbi:hypothetical protein PCASD_21878 [Puccinia coronata f. sp. avenae]|uniref:Uncharacterized protein n=1 Tax=Puccinia coronata f. sp. avenae TaxID=200324 RepID=A0A2N5SHV0_9BASI|nr:hypothetical protein PCASD_21878 [Puccinia coronata f. sp. avenae]